MVTRKENNNRYALMGLVLLGFVFWGARSLWDSSEARYGQVAFEMLTSGNWLVPTLAGEPHLTKPPFTYWMAAAGMQLFGINAWGARFFLSVFFTGTLLGIRELARTLGFDRRQALAAAVIFGTSIVPFIGGHTLTTDAFLTFWETLVVLAAWKVWQGPVRQIPYWRMLFWGALGMGFFTKGPPALLPLAVIAAFLWICRDRHRQASLMSLPGIGLFIGLSAWWFAILIARDPALLQYFLGNELLGRITSTIHERNDPFWIYVPVILLGAGPWMVLWPRTVTRIYHLLRDKTLLQKDRQLFLLLWFTIPLGVFMLAKSRMPLYVMPLFAPLSLVMANVWRTEIGPRLRQSPLRWRTAVIGFTAWPLALTAFTVYPDRFPGARSCRPTAMLFSKTLARMEAPGRLYWIFGGHQKFSIPFYMQRVVSYAERFDRHTSDPPPDRGKHQARVLYITRTILLPLILKAPNPPVVRAKDDKYALIEWPRTETSREASVQVQTPGAGAAQSPDAGLPALHASHQSGLYAVLLLILAGSRH